MNGEEEESRRLTRRRLTRTRELWPFQFYFFNFKKADPLGVGDLIPFINGGFQVPKN